MSMTVYHGTSAAALTPIREGGLDKRRRNYTKKPCACTTTDLKVAQTFAARKTGSDDWLAGRLTGVVLEFTLSGVVVRDYEPARDPSCMQNEAEIAVYNPKKLSLVALWRHDGNGWVRELAAPRVAMAPRHHCGRLKLRAEDTTCDCQICGAVSAGATVPAAKEAVRKRPRSRSGGN
jgi:hypothetical protein